MHISAFLYTKIHEKQYGFFGQETCTSSCTYALGWDQLPEYSQNY